MPERTAVLALVLVTLAGCASVSPPPPPVRELPFPSPLDGPGVPALPEADSRAVADAWRWLAAGDETRAGAAVRDVGGRPAELLALQVRALEDPAIVLDDLTALTEVAPGYAAAWRTLAYAAERAGAEAEALAAATRAGRLWPGSDAPDAAAALRRRLVDDRVERGRAMLAHDPAAALELAETALAHAPDLEAARLLRAEALLAKDPAAAEAALAELGSPRARMLLARVAERGGDYTRALELYQGLPEDTPGRDEALERVRWRWRLANLPPHVQAAMRSPALTRAQLAVLLVDLAPQVEALAGAAAPVLPDVVGLPSQRQILSAVRLGLLSVDPVDRRFEPERPVDLAAVERALDRLAQALDVAPLRWCSGEGDGKCVHRPTAPTGEEVTRAVLALVEVLGR